MIVSGAVVSNGVDCGGANPTALRDAGVWRGAVSSVYGSVCSTMQFK